MARPRLVRHNSRPIKQKRAGPNEKAVRKHASTEEDIPTFMEGPRLVKQERAGPERQNPKEHETVKTHKTKASRP